MKVYCKDCKYLVKRTTMSEKVYYHCKHSNNYLDDWYGKKSLYKTPVNVRNANNNCPDYKPKLMRRIKDIFTAKNKENK